MCNVMKTLIYILTLPLTIFAQGNWTQLTNVPDNIGGATGFSIGSKGYVGLGYNPFYVQNFYAYDTTLNSWNSIASFPGVANCYAESFSINNKGYLTLGQQYGTPKNELWEYDPINDQWSQKTNYPSIARTEAISFVINNKAYCGTGSTGTAAGLTKDIYEYDPITDTWTQKANFGGGKLMSGVSFAIGNKGYVGLGQDSSFTLKNTFWEYDAVTDQWTQKANFPGNARIRAVAFTINGLGYVGTGNDNINSKFDFYEYNPTTDSWQQISNLSSIPRQTGIAFNIGNVGYVGTGGNLGSPYYSDFWKFSAGIPTNISSIKVNELCEPFPNPINTYLNFECYKKIKYIYVLNSLGQTLKEIKVLSETIDLKSFENGIYFLKIVDNNNSVITKRIIVEK